MPRKNHRQRHGRMIRFRCVAPNGDTVRIYAPGEIGAAARAAAVLGVPAVQVMPDRRADRRRRGRRG